MPIPTLIEQLTTHFYEWEQRGRGWNIWDSPIDPEPPFVPFYSHFSPAGIQYDDGQMPTFLSSLAEKVKRKLHPVSYKKEDDYLVFDSSIEEVSPQPFENTGEIRELKIVLPYDYKVIPEYVEQCLLNMTMESSLISFEILGSQDSITIQFACRETYTSFVEQEIKAYFPDCTITQSENSFVQLLSDKAEKNVAVDFGLSEEFMRPIRIFDSFNPDPLTGIFGVLDNLKEGDTALLQVLFKAAEAPWAESMMRSVTNYDGDSFFLDAPEMVKLAHEKCKYPLFAVNVRILGRGTDEQRSWEIVKSLANCLNVYTDSQSNELIPLENTSYETDAHVDDIIFRQTHRSGMILNSAELVSIVHFPSQSVVSKKLRSGNQKTIEAPPTVSGNEFTLGENIHDGKIRTVTLSHEQRMRHMHVLGATGTGKSTLLLNLISQDLSHGVGFTVLDPHGDLIESILERVPDERINDVILFDPGDEQYPLGFNILEAQSEIEKNVLSSDLVEIFRRFSTSWGDQMSVVLGNAITALVENRETYSLLDLRRFLIEKDFREMVLKGALDNHIQYFWEKEFPLLRGSSLSSILTRLDFFLRPRLVRNVVGQKQGVNLKDVVDTNKIFLVKLSQGIIGDENAYLLGSLIVSKLHQVIMQRQTMRSHERNPFYLYIDEFQNFITPSMKAILSGARKYNFGLVLAHQDLHQLWETDIALANSVITNAGTRICFRVGEFDAQKLEGGFAHFDMGDMQKLNVGEAIVRVERSDHDFNLKTSIPERIEVETARKNRDDLILFSRTKYAQKPTEIKKDFPEAVPSKREEPEYKTENLKENNDIPTKPTKAESRYTEQKNVSFHRYLQTLIKRMAEQRGFKAVIEEATTDKQGRIDVGLERNDERIACEITVTTKDDHEIKNIEKCFQSGFQKVLVCVPEKTRIDDLQKLINKQFDQESASRIFLVHPDELFLFFERETSNMEPQDQGKIVKGYRVKLNYKSVQEKEEKKKREAISQVILQSVRRMKE